MDSTIIILSDHKDKAPGTRHYLQAAEYDGEDLTIGQYLETLERPPNLTDDEFRKLRKKAHQYLVRDGYLYK